jgi:hypothetical protein
MARGTRHVVEVTSCGADDPDGSRAACVLAAYFHAEHMRTFRRLLWRRLALFAAVFLVSAAAISLPERACVIGGGVLVATAAWAAILEWRAEQKLTMLLTQFS